MIGGEGAEVPCPEYPLRELAEDLGRAGTNFRNPGEGFDCRRCGVRYVPAPKQWVFHDLCDGCFALFDEQKMRGRFVPLGGEPPPGGVYFESCEAWMEAFPFQSEK